MKIVLRTGASLTNSESYMSALVFFLIYQMSLGKEIKCECCGSQSFLLYGILQRNYPKMTMQLLFFYNTFVKLSPYTRLPKARMLNPWLSEKKI